MNKKDRQTLIIKIIREKDIKTQTELVEELRKNGLYATQATVSRDIKNLKLIKEIGSNGSVYKVSGSSAKEFTSVKQVLMDIFVNTVLKIERVEYIIVLHTRPGGASNLAFHIDQEEIEGIAGTIAGDDTILIILNDKTVSMNIYNMWREWLS